MNLLRDLAMDKYRSRKDTIAKVAKAALRPLRFLMLLCVKGLACSLNITVFLLPKPSL